MPKPPADHILDEFLGKHGVRVSFDEASELLANLRDAFAREENDELSEFDETHQPQGEDVPPAYRGAP